MSVLVSILTPSLNQAEFLPDCLHSVARQSYRPIEHVVFDGGSSDGTLELLRNAVGQNVIWVSEPDRGQADALNRAFARSEGDIIGWLNADDAYFDVRAIEFVVDYFARHPECDAVFGDVLIIDGENRLVRHHRAYLPPVWTKLPEHASPLAQPAVFVRRSALNRTGTFLREDLHVSLDLELWLRLTAAGVDFHHVSRILAVDRDHQGRKVHRLRELRLAENRKLSAEYGIEFADRHHSRLRAWLRRAIGATHLIGLEHHYTLAVEIDLRAPVMRLARQLLLTNRSAIGRR